MSALKPPRRVMDSTHLDHTARQHWVDRHAHRTAPSQCSTPALRIALHATKVRAAPRTALQDLILLRDQPRENVEHCVCGSQKTAKQITNSHNISFTHRAAERHVCTLAELTNWAHSACCNPIKNHPGGAHPTHIPRAADLRRPPNKWVGRGEGSSIGVEGRNGRSRGGVGRRASRLEYQ